VRWPRLDAAEQFFPVERFVERKIFRNVSSDFCSNSDRNIRQIARNLERARLEWHGLTVTIPIVTNHACRRVSCRQVRRQRIIHLGFSPDAHGMVCLRAGNERRNLYHRPVERLPVPSAVRACRSPSTGHGVNTAKSVNNPDFPELQ
jgi:hypothetical protein